MKFIVTYELENTGLKCAALITDNYNEAVGFIECEIRKMQIDNPNDIVEKIERFEYVEGNYCERFTLRTDKFTYHWFLYDYDERESISYVH